MTTYEKFDEDSKLNWLQMCKKMQKKKIPAVRMALIETLETLSRSPMDKETYNTRAKNREKEYDTVDWILRNLNDKKEVNVEGHVYVGLSQEIRNDIKKYGVMKLAETLIEEFNGEAFGGEHAEKWRKKYRS